MLRFDPVTHAIYEREEGPARARFLSVMILLGLGFYNLYNLSAMFLMPDIFWESVIARSVLFTMPSVTLAWAVLRVDPVLREQLILFGMIGAFAVPVFLFWWTRAPLGDFAFSELDLTLVFGGLVLGLRFRYCLVFLACALPMMQLAIWLKPDIYQGLAFALSLQALTVCVFVGVSNYMIERRRCLGFLAVVRERQRTSVAKQQTARVERLSRIDPLTGLPNRRALDQELDLLFDQGSDLSILMVDIDHFKRLNDAEGHAVGDQCLEQVGEILLQIANEQVVFAARYGGEEFVIVLADAAPFQVARVARNMLNRIRAAGIPHPNRPDGKGIITLSIGAAQSSDQGNATVATVMKDADSALYEAKAQGRDRVVIAQNMKRRVLRA